MVKVPTTPLSVLKQRYCATACPAVAQLSTGTTRCTTRATLRSKTSRARRPRLTTCPARYAGTPRFTINQPTPHQGAVTFPQPPSASRDAGLPSTMHASHQETHADTHMQHVREQLLQRIRCAFAEQAALFDSEANGAQASPATQPHVPTSSAGGSPLHTTPVQGVLEAAKRSPPTHTPATDDASLFDSLPPLVDDILGPPSTSVPVRAPRTSLGDGVCMDAAPSAALSDVELDILAPSPLPPGTAHCFSAIMQ